MFAALARLSSFRSRVIPTLVRQLNTSSLYRPFPKNTIPAAGPLSNKWGQDDILSDYVSKKPEDSHRTAEQRWADRSEAALADLATNPPANAYSGRSVQVVGGNVAEAYQKLDSILSRNKVRQQLRLAERHEKKGAKRRRLSSERWRKQFAHEVRKKVQLVTKIRNRGA